ncbi:MAG: MYXO-CTERM sorting domain-containing protein [Myxococcota bacterium]
MKKFLVAAGAVAVLFAAIPDASARSARVNQVPNGLERSCQTCHTVALPQVGNGPLNDFGMDVNSNLEGTGVSATVDWPAVCDLDSDGDGFTNGEELGDPDCTWTTGSNAGDYQSDPADADSTPPQGGEDAGGDADAGDTDAGSDDAGVDEDAGGEEDAGDGMDAGDDSGTNGGNDDGGSDDEGCSTTGGSAPVSAAVALLGFLLAGAWRRRR